MAKTGDTVRFLNSVGGGKITRIEGNMAYVDDSGFETPVLLKEIVVVLPAGHENQTGGVKKMFDQKAFDEGKKSTPSEKAGTSPTKTITAGSTVSPAHVEETTYGDKINIALAFEPTDVMHLDKSEFSAVLVNDSNYWLDFIFMRRATGEKGWTSVYRGSVLPNESVDLAVISHETLGGYERIALQCIASKQGKEFTLFPPVNAERKLDLTKFHKFHCFRPGLYFDSPVLEIPIVKEGIASEPVELDPSQLRNAMSENGKSNPSVAELSKKYKIDSRHKTSRNNVPEQGKPGKLLEIDLHIAELLDSTAGMEAKDILGVQLDTVRKYMKENSHRKGQKIVFIHGKGEGVLRKEVLSLLRKEWPKAELQDASFREYGFGATLVTIH